MIGIGIRTPVRMLFKWLELAFKCFESRSNGSNASNPNRMVGIRTLRILFKWLGMQLAMVEFAFECFESFLMVGIECLESTVQFELCSNGLNEFAFKCFESCSNGSNPVQMVEIGIWNPNVRMLGSNPVLRIGWNLHFESNLPFESRFEFAFKWFESRSNGSNLHSNGSNPV